ncbi:voltage-gated hydrogen channel 1 [Fusarium subglutinans]|uniref:Voltage-gated hydrogen channel 1 n=1 Tax=Gibberella subglutinans TaxID=42677 RepID=A0A8H5UKX4_GIBSU|nr:voltage-gated hydrogen channel 1 [Fusarium subglutinans]KAF5591588.1 voltage-gated hydrogen channel 1 [Fusarium subglutinans]
MSSTSVEHVGDSLEEQPLLRRGKRRLPSLNIQHWHSHPFRGDPWSVRSTKQKTAQFLSSKAGHYSVLTLVSLDVLSMIADFILNLFKCEQGKKGSDWDLALEILGSVSLVFSCLFVVELIASVWAFGWKSVQFPPNHIVKTDSPRYFNSWFHCFDAFIVIAGFVTDVALRGIIEEVASLIVVMRLWRVVKIIEELGVGAQEQTEELNEKLEKFESENEDLRSEISRLKGAMRKAGLDQQDIGGIVS